MQQANASYAAMVELLLRLIGINVSISIENPKNSLLWKCSALQSFCHAVRNVHSCIFQHCTHGGKRDESILRLNYNPRQPDVDLFAPLGLICTKQHEHASWKPYTDSTGKRVYPTAEEAAYPKLLCARIASILKQEALRLGIIFAEDLETQLHNNPNAAKRQTFTTQP